jgi:hypothetical protein
MASILKVDTINPQTASGSISYAAAILPITNNTSTSLALTAAHENVTLSNASAVAVTVPTGVLGKVYRLKNLGAGVVTLTGTGGQTFFGVASTATFTLGTGDTIMIQWNGTYWLVWF